MFAIAACGTAAVVDRSPSAPQPAPGSERQSALPSAPRPAPQTALPSAGALPTGEGRDILVRECLNCHQLDALELFRGFYTEDRWRSLVLTMRENGAEVDDRQVDVLAEYLAQHFGTDVE